MNRDTVERLNGELKGYQGMPFWSWNNELDEHELVRQIEDMKRAGLGGFVMHARTGLKDEYLGEKWFSCIAACLKKARELEMSAWIYDENGWPSGFAGGKLLEVEEYRARFLEYGVGEFDKTAFVSYVKNDTGYFRIEKAEAGVTEYHNIYLRISPANTDILNPKVTDAFIEQTHEEYYKRFNESFGKELVGFFTDEPQYYRAGTPYTHCIEEVFEKNGENVLDGLIWLFIHDERGYAFREKYYGALNELYVKNFYKKVYDWCEEHDCKLTGHTVEESFLAGQMWGGAAVMPTYEFEHIPAIDWLGRDCKNELSPKQIGSVASQLGIRQVLTETFACSGFDVTPKELKSIGEYQYFNGVSLMCHHLYPYSIAGWGKIDHPPVFSPHSNWFKEFKTFNDYFTRLGYIISNTKELYDVAILHPMRGVWLDYVRREDGKSVEALQKSLDELLLTLRKRGILFHFIDEKILEKHGTIKEGRLRVGECEYNRVIIPDMKTLAKNTYSLLKEYTGKLLMMGDIQYLDGERAKVDLHTNMTMEELDREKCITYSCEDGRSFATVRTGELGEFLFVKNLSSFEQSHIHLGGIAEEYCIFDLETLQTSRLPEEYVLEAGQGLVLIRDEEAQTIEYMDEEQDITSAFQVTDITENYLVLDYAQISRRGEEFGDRRPISGIFEELLRENYKGELRIRQTFMLKETMPVTLMMEKADFSSVLVNGKEVCVTQSDFDIKFVEAEITDQLIVGENELIYNIDFWQHEGVRFALFDPMATESLKNCLYYDASIEKAYLKGNFTVNPDMSIDRRKTLPEITSELYENGYPFFKGRLTMAGKIEYEDAESTILCLNGHFIVAEVYINDEKTEFVLDSRKEITSLLKEGENDIKIVLKSSLRNLLGPHHVSEDPEPRNVGPYHFDFRGCWTDGKDARHYTHQYNSVPFGLDSVKIISRTTKEKACNKGGIRREWVV